MLAVDVLPFLRLLLNSEYYTQCENVKDFPILLLRFYVKSMHNVTDKIKRDEKLCKINVVYYRTIYLTETVQVDKK